MAYDNWFIEDFEKQVGGLSFKIDKVLFDETSPFQRVKVIKNSFFGNVMLLDDLVMLTEKDEFYYHDMLVHVPLMCTDNPEDVLIIGGGDGGSVREALKHPTVKRVVLCEIDKMVIDVAKEFFPYLSCCLDDERVEIMVADGIEYVNAHKNEFDAICIDSTDPIGPAVGLFTPEFYKSVNESLTPQGTMSAQTESPAWSPAQVIKIASNIRKVFGNAHVYLSPSPCYPSGTWSYTLGIKSEMDPASGFDIGRAEQIASQCKYYNPDIHKAAFALPNFIREAL
jgi:spermidine synthase